MPVLLSVNVGLPRDAAWQGKTVHTGIWKEPAVSVTDTDALLYLPGRDTAKLRLAAQIPALSPGWQRSFRELIDAAERGGPATALPPGTEPGARPGPAWNGFRRLRVSKVGTGRAPGELRPQRNIRALRRQLAQPAGPGRCLRRAYPVELPDWRRPRPGS